jgi:hypothetical protein
VTSERTDLALGDLNEIAERCKFHQEEEVIA